MNIWDKTINVTTEIAQKLIENQFSYKVNNIKFLGSGYDNSAFLVNQEIVFRFPHLVRNRIVQSLFPSNFITTILFVGESFLGNSCFKQCKKYNC